MNALQTREHPSQFHTKELPPIPPYKQLNIQEKRKRDSRVRFSLPANTLLDVNDQEVEAGSVSSATNTTNNSSISTRGIFEHHKSKSTAALPAYKKSKRRNSMFLFETTSHNLNKDTHGTFVTPENNSHFKISIPLVIRTPPKLSKVSSPGDRLLDKELIFNGDGYEMIEVIDDDDDDDDEVQIIGEKKKGVSTRGSPLRQPPMNRKASNKSPQEPASPTKAKKRSPAKNAETTKPGKSKVRSSAENSQTKTAENAVTFTRTKEGQIIQNSSPLKPALKQQPLPSGKNQKPIKLTSSQQEVNSPIQDTYQQQLYHYPSAVEQQQSLPHYTYPERLPSSERAYYEIFPPAETDNSEQYSSAGQQETINTYSYPPKDTTNTYSYPANDYNPGNTYNPYNEQPQFQEQKSYHFPAQSQNPYQEYANQNPYLQQTPPDTQPVQVHSRYDTSPPQTPVQSQSQSQKTLTFPSPEASRQLHERNNDIDNRYYEEANKKDYTQTVSEARVPNQEKILSQSPRRHNHTRSKSQINILTAFDDLNINGDKEAKPSSSPRIHNHTKSKSQFNIITDFDNKEPHQQDVIRIPSSKIYSQTASVREITIPELSNEPLAPSEAKKVNSKLDFYLKDQMERTSVREKVPPLSNTGKAQTRDTAQPRRPLSPINSHSSYDSELSLGRSNSTYATSVGEQDSVMIDLTNENQEVLVTRNKAKGSISSYRSIKQKDKNGKSYDVVLVDDDDDALDLIDQYASDFEVHDSMNRKNSVVSVSGDLGKVYSMYRKFGNSGVSNVRQGQKSSMRSFKPQEKRMAQTSQRMSSVDSGLSTSSFQAGDEQNIIVGNIHDSKGPITNSSKVMPVKGKSSKSARMPMLNVVSSATLRQRYPTSRLSKKVVRVTSDLVSEPSSVKSTTEILNPVDNLFTNRVKRDAKSKRISEMIIHEQQENSDPKGDYLDYNNSSYDFDSFIQSN